VQDVGIRSDGFSGKLVYGFNWMTKRCGKVNTFSKQK
jgi:hypothetical protein